MGSEHTSSAAIKACMRSLPPELFQLPQWVGWRAEERDARITKVPYYFPNLRPVPASVTNPGTWMRITELVTRLGNYIDSGHEWNGGIGFVFTENDHYVGIDLDHCRNCATGGIEQWARDIIDELDSYTEASPSGTGVHIIARGVLPRCGKKGNIEMYDRGRFFTMTGQRILEVVS